MYEPINGIVKGGYSQYFGKKTLNLGSAGILHEGMINADLYHPDADIKFDARLPWPFEDELDAVYASHTLEHFSGEEALDVLWHMGNAMKVGGHLVAVVPYGTSELHFANPFHKQPWTLATLGHFDRRFHEDDGMNQSQPLHAWTLVDPILRFADDVPKDMSFNDRMALAYRQINVVKEMYFALKLEEK